MIRTRRLVHANLLVIACLACACSLKRPGGVPPVRMIEPQVVALQLPNAERVATSASNAVDVRLLSTLARGHISRRMLHLQANGELSEDSVWRWSSDPSQYLDTAVRMELSSNPRFRLVDTGVSTISATLLVWAIESEAEAHLVGAVEFQFTGPDRVVHSQTVRGTEPVSAELPGNLATASGNLLRRLAADGVKRVAPEGPNQDAQFSPGR